MMLTRRSSTGGPGWVHFVAYKMILWPVCWLAWTRYLRRMPSKSGGPPFAQESFNSARIPLQVGMAAPEAYQGVGSEELDAEITGMPWSSCRNGRTAPSAFCQAR